MCCCYAYLCAPCCVFRQSCHLQIKWVNLLQNACMCQLSAVAFQPIESLHTALSGSALLCCLKAQASKQRSCLQSMSQMSKPSYQHCRPAARLMQLHLARTVAERHRLVACLLCKLTSRGRHIQLKHFSGASEEICGSNSAASVYDRWCTCSTCLSSPGDCKAALTGS